MLAYNKSALRKMAQANFDLGLLQETKITDWVYTWNSTGFCVIALDTPSRRHWGVALFYKYSPRFAVEYYQQHGVNVISFQLVKG